MELMILIAKIILIIIQGEPAEEAVKKVAEASGISYLRLWNELPNRFK